jgi:hypothetical protein
VTIGAPRWWWLSFVDRAADGDDTVAMHLGCAIVMATCMEEAVHEAWTRRINPGGEVAGMPLKPGIFRVLADRQRFTYRLLEDADITQAQLAIEREEALIPDSTVTGVCFHDGTRICRDPHHDARSISFGRCRSGRRWFWFAVRHDPGPPGQPPHCDAPECIYQGPHACGKEDTEATAIAAGRAAAERLAEDRPAVVWICHGMATRVLREINAWERKVKLSASTGGQPAGHLYVPCVEGSRHFSDEEWGYSRPRREPRRWVDEVPIVKKTAKRIYYDISENWDRDRGVIKLGHIDRQALERDGKISIPGNGNRWELHGTEFFATREDAEAQLSGGELGT